MSKKSEIKELEQKITAAKFSYYNSPNDIQISDQEYDDLEAQLKAIDPENLILKKVGSEVKGNTKKKYVHKNVMLSLAKSNSTEDTNKWIDKIGIEKDVICATFKYDGMSCSIIYNNGKIDKIASRGDSKIGSDLSFLQNYLSIVKNIPLKNELEIRGELILSKNSSLELNGSPRRNLVSGLCMRKNSNLDDIKQISFVAYQIIGSEFKKESEKLDWLKKNGFNTAPYKLLTGKKEVENYFKEYVESRRSDYEFETDGVVYTTDDNNKWEKINSKYEISHHNYYNLAQKPLSEAAETELLGIEFNVSRNGNLIPTALLKPVILGGREVKRATLNNYKNVIDLDLRVGDRVLIKLANDVIPFFAARLTEH